MAGRRYSCIYQQRSLRSIRRQLLIQLSWHRCYPYQIPLRRSPIQAEDITEDDIVPLDIIATLQDGKVIPKDQLDVSYVIDPEGTAQVEVIDHQLYAYGAGDTSISANVSYNGETVASNVINLHIKESDVPKTITSYAKVEVETTPGTIPVLPDMVRATFDIGFPKNVPVVWDSIPEEAYSHYGTFTVKGTVEGQQLQPEATVIVKGILSAKNLSVTTPVGFMLDLPQTTTAYYSDGSTAQHEIVWNDYDQEKLQTENTFTIDGTLKDTDIP